VPAGHSMDLESMVVHRLERATYLNFGFELIQI
jgi:hypothetical protein